MLSDEGNYWAQQNIDFQEDVEKDVETDFPVLFIAFSFEAVAVESHVPIGESVEELEQLGNHVVELVLSHLLPDTAQESLEGGFDPAIRDVEPGQKGFDVLGEEEVAARVTLPLGDVLDEEAVGIVPGQEDVSHDSVHSFVLVEVEVVRANQGRVDEVHPDCVSAELVADLHRVGVVLEALAHLLAVAGEDETVDDKVLVRVAVLDAGGDDVERVEPAASLIDSLSDEVSWEYLRELLLAGAEGVVHLGEGH